MFALNRKFNFLDSYRVPLEVAPGWSMLYMAATAAGAVAPSLRVVAVAQFVAAVQEQSGKLLPPILFMFATLAAERLMNAVQRWIKIKLEAVFRLKIRGAYFDRMATLRYEHIESNRVQELIRRIFMYIGSETDALDEVMIWAFKTGMSLIEIIIRLGTLLAVVIGYSPLIGIAVTVLSAPVLYRRYKEGSLIYNQEGSYRKNSMASANLGKALLLRDWKEERFLFSFSETLNRKWVDNFRIIAENMKKINSREQANIAVSMLAGTFLNAAGIIAAAYLISIGKLSLPAMVALTSALVTLSALLLGDETIVLTEDVADFRERFKDLTTFATLSSTEDTGTAEAPAHFESLVFRNVRFRYPGSENYILDGLNLTVERGKHYAFVGVNGAGKTTITKLILGLYDSYEGEILLNGRELREYTLESRRKLFSTVFQDFVHYEIPLDENIRLGNDDVSDAEVLEALKTVGLSEKVETLENGAKTLLGKLRPGGIDLSGGEWQRIAMARSAVSHGQVKILDEPTAALDPIAESQVYRNFGNLSRGSTTIFISHRLGSTRLADVIYVLDAGKVVECGSHEALMELHGIYYEMFDSQRSWYL